MAALHGMQVSLIPLQEHHEDYCCDDIEIWEVTLATDSTSKDSVASLPITASATGSAYQLKILSWGEGLSSIRVQICTNNKPALDLLIHQTPGSVVGCYVWTSAVVTSRYLLSPAFLSWVELSHPPTSKRVSLELGAGCGLCSLITYHLGWHSIATDVAAVVPILEKNCVQNRASITNCYDTAILNWRDEHSVAGVKSNILQLHAGIQTFPDMIICSDLLYASTSVEDLFGILKQVCIYHVFYQSCSNMFHYVVYRH